MGPFSQQQKRESFFGSHCTDVMLLLKPEFEMDWYNRYKYGLSKGYFIYNQSVTPNWTGASDVRFNVGSASNELCNREPE
jgi:hypothetical protein